MKLYNVFLYDKRDNVNHNSTIIILIVINYYRDYQYIGIDS